jgi:hypothetical protein
MWRNILFLNLFYKIIMMFCIMINFDLMKYAMNILLIVVFVISMECFILVYIKNYVISFNGIVFGWYSLVCYLCSFMSVSSRISS